MFTAMSTVYVPLPEPRPEAHIRRMNDDIMRRIEARLTSLGKTAAGASLEANLSKDAIRNLQRFPNTTPSLGTLVALSAVLGVSPAWLAFGIEEPEDHRSQAWFHIPIVSWVAASQFADMPDPSSMNASEFIDVAGLSASQYMALRVIGDSMDLIAPDKSIIIVDLHDKMPIRKKFYVFSMGSSATFKRFMSSPDRLEPYSTNKEYDPIFPDREVCIIGRVVRVIIDC